MPVFVHGGIREYIPATGPAWQLLADDGTTVLASMDSVGGSTGAAGDIVTADLAANAVTGAKFATGVVQQTLLDGVDETGTPTYTVTGMSGGDEVVGFLVLTTKASIATMAQRLNADFTPASDALTVVGHAADNSSNQIILTWIHKT